MSTAKTADQVRTVPLDKLKPDPHQVRKNFDKEGLRTLADNLKQRGVLTPLLVREVGKSLVIVDGERRWRAAKLAKLKTVPIVVRQDEGDVQRKLDQVAVNSLREPLKPLELGRLLVDLRKSYKLSDNQIAAHLDKQGIPALSKAQMAELMQLVDMPKWAQDMVDDGRLQAPSGATILYAAKDPKILKMLHEEIDGETKMGGRMDAAEVSRILAMLYSVEGDADLTQTESYNREPVLFNLAIACKGCEHLRAIGRAKVCMNRKHFEQLQSEAKEAGLLPGGKKPPKPLKGAEQEEERVAEQRSETKQASKAEKLRRLVQKRLQQHLVEVALTDQTTLKARLTLWLAARQPNGHKWGRQWFSEGENDNLSRSRAVEEAVEQSALKSLPDFLSAEGVEAGELANQLAHAAVELMSWSQVQALAMHLQVDISKAFTVDADYLALQSLDQLKELGRLGHIGEANKMTGKALKVAILDSPDAIAKLGVPADVVRLYADVPEAEPVDFDDEDTMDDPDAPDGLNEDLEDQAA